MLQRGLSGWPLVALVGALAGAVVLVASQAGDRATAGDGGVAVAGGVGGDVNVGTPAETLAVVVQGLTSPDPADRAEALELLRARLPEGAAIQAEAVAAILRVLGGEAVPPEELVARFEALAQRHVELLDRLGALEAEDPATARLVEDARAAVAGGRYAEADSLLARAEDAELAAVRQAEALAEQALEAARARRATAAEVRAERGALARQQLDYRQAAAHYADAAAIAPEPEAEWRYEMERASALADLGLERGDNGALREAIGLHREVVLPLAPRAERPDDWAQKQMSLGIALAILGGREPGPERLEEAVVAYRLALEERTRERDPLGWADTAGNLGAALTVVAERAGDASMAEEAVELLGEAAAELRAGGHAPWAQWTADRLAEARAVRDRLTAEPHAAE